KKKRTNYVRGREVEYKCKAALVKEGYEIMRASSSKGVFDIIAFNGECTRYIQLKREMKRQGSYPSVREEIRQVAVPEYVIGVFNEAEVAIPIPNTKELWIWTDKLGWSQWTIKQDGNDEHTDLRRGRRKANKS
ncbi:MAG: hypothetical protein KAR39_11655, partial [Thermoplasmata archaeon]|nr:hypothetical protein [Thermoplasmata archaeon]